MTTVLSGANVVDPVDGEVVRGVSVVLDGPRIAAVTTTPPTDAPAIDARGAYVVPGFVDAHAHALELKDPRGAHELMLAFGVTGYRQMSGSAELLARRRADGLADSPDAPAVLHLPGALLSPLNASSASEVRAAIRSQKADGADFVKMGMVSGELYPAAQEEANAVGIPLGGHLPPTTPAEEAVAAGIRFIEHLGPGLGLLASCASNRDELRVRLAAQKAPRLPSAKLPFMDRVFAVVLARIVVNPMIMTSAETVEIMRSALDHYDDGLARELAALLAASGTWQCPTLIREKTNECGDDEAWARDPNLRYVSAKTRALWAKTARKAAALPESTRRVFHDLYTAQQRLTGVLAEAGVPLLAGSDVTGASWEIPGASLHQEFDELAAAGLSPMQVLRATTSDAGRFFGRDDVGRVAAGARADLVLLGSDPTASVSALHDVVGVVRHGVHRDAAALAALREHVAATGAAG